MSEKLYYSKAETRRRLNVGRLRYEYLIAAEILAKPIEIVPGSRPVHTAAQIHSAEQKSQREMESALQPKGRKMRPLSAKLLSEI